MDTSTTLEEQIQALMDSLADTALSAAESRHQSQAGEAHLLYALYRNDGLVGSMLRGYGLESSEIRLLMSDIPNRPLKMGEDPTAKRRQFMCRIPQGRDCRSRRPCGFRQAWTVPQIRRQTLAAGRGGIER